MSTQQLWNCIPCPFQLFEKRYTYLLPLNTPFERNCIPCPFQINRKTIYLTRAHKFILIPQLFEVFHKTQTFVKVPIVFLRWDFFCYDHKNCLHLQIHHAQGATLKRILFSIGFLIKRHKDQTQ